jgi:hypothetical protein
MTERAVLLIRRRRPIGEPPDVRAGSIAGAGVLQGSAGAGRILHTLAELGLSALDVTQSLHAADTEPEDLDRLDLGQRFATVILGSHLVNTPDEPLRRAYLSAARRHLDGRGDLLVEHHPVDWAETAEPTLATPGAEVGMRDVRRDPPLVSAVSVYDIGGRIVRQPFTARVLSDEELDAELTTVGLRRRRRLSASWLKASLIAPQREYGRSEGNRAGS